MMKSYGRVRRPLNRDRRNERGAVLALFVLSAVMLMLMLAVAIDLGVAYVMSSTLTKAADAGALAAARYQGVSADDAEALALSVAQANFPADDGMVVNFDSDVTFPSIDTVRVLVTANAESPTFFGKTIGREKLAINTASQATRNPLDMSLVLDVSGSLSGVFGDLQDAANRFIGFFNEDIDQLGVVSYSTTAEEVQAVAKKFKSTAVTSVNGMSADGWTNIDDGLRLGKAQLDAAPLRADAIKIVVLFTDGQPTAFSDEFDMGGNPDTYNGTVAGDWNVRMYETSTGDRVRGFDTAGNAITCCQRGNAQPTVFPGNLAVTGENLLKIAANQAAGWADAIREDGYTVYTVGLGNVDRGYLRSLANEGGVSNPRQPKGQLYYAPTAAQLEEAFNQLADRILTRLVD